MVLSVRCTENHNENKKQDGYMQWDLWIHQINFTFEKWHVEFKLAEFNVAKRGQTRLCKLFVIKS